MKPSLKFKKHRKMQAKKFNKFLDSLVTQVNSKSKYFIGINMSEFCPKNIDRVVNIIKKSMDKVGVVDYIIYDKSRVTIEEE